MVKVSYLGLNRDQVKTEFGAIRDKLIQLAGQYHPARNEYQAICAIKSKLDEAADLLAGEPGVLLPKITPSKTRVGDLDPIALRIGKREIIK